MDLAQVSEVSPAFDKKNISIILLSPECLLLVVKVYPVGDAFADVVKMVMSTEKEVHSMRGSDRSCLLRGRGECEELLSECNVLRKVDQIRDASIQFRQTLGTLRKRS